MESESFSCGFDVNEGLDVDICVECESFSFDSIIIGHLFEPSKSEFSESGTFVPMTADLDHPIEHSNIKRLVDLNPLMCLYSLFMMVNLLGGKDQVVSLL